MLLLLLSGCSVAPAIHASAPTVVETPQELRSCPTTPAPIPVPPKPRTFDSVVQWANATEAQRAATEHALEVCRSRLERLLMLMGSR